MSTPAPSLRAFAYTVRCVIESRSVADRWLAWLRDDHLDEVVSAGATSADVVELDGDRDRAETTFEVRYRFESRAAFDAYERDHAPRLRADGLARFPMSLGLAYARTTGEIVVAR